MSIVPIYHPTPNKAARNLKESVQWLNDMLDIIDAVVKNHDTNKKLNYEAGYGAFCVTLNTGWLRISKGHLSAEVTFPYDETERKPYMQILKKFGAELKKKLDWIEQNIEM